MSKPEMPGMTRVQQHQRGPLLADLLQRALRVVQGLQVS
jgi:hypothetical protein